MEHEETPSTHFFNKKKWYSMRADSIVGYRTYDSSREPCVNKLTRTLRCACFKVGPVLSKTKISRLFSAHPDALSCTTFQFEQAGIRKIELCRMDLCQFDSLYTAETISFKQNSLCTLDFQNAAFQNVITLNLSFNSLSKLTKMNYLERITILILSNNCLKNLKFLQTVSLGKTIQTLYIDNNHLSSLKSIAELVLMESLLHLSIHNNPIPINYLVESFIITSCPNLVKLGNVSITQETRHRVSKWIQEDPEGKEIERCVDVFRNYFGVLQTLNIPVES